MAIAEYALYNVSTPIAVLTHCFPDKLQESLPTPEQLEREMETVVKALEAQSKQKGDRKKDD